MGEKHEVNVNSRHSIWIALAILLVMFWGEPDLTDSLICALQDNCVEARDAGKGK